LVLLWVVPVTFVASITTLETLDVWADGLSSVDDAHPILAGLVQGVIPTLLLVIFMAVLPYLMGCTPRHRAPSLPGPLPRANVRHMR
jgi:hypothetical protein